MQTFNAKWAARLELFRRLNPPPHWAPGAPLDAALRARYESCLPVAEFLTNLARVGRRVLPSPELLPLCLADAAARAGHDALGPAPFPSLPDLWSTLPDAFVGRVTFGGDDWLPLFCALADPPRFGTDFGRYPDQLAAIRRTLGAGASKSPQKHTRLLDLGCGTGQGTYELAETIAELQQEGGRPVRHQASRPGVPLPGLAAEGERKKSAQTTATPEQQRPKDNTAKAGSSNSTKRGLAKVSCTGTPGPGNGTPGLLSALGVTREPLEVWMAANRRLPHDPERERRFQARTAGLKADVRFLAGDALAAPCARPFDLITANGLVGGRFLRTPQALARFLDEAERLLAPHGLLALANRFHEGERPALESFADAARRRGWTVDGSPGNLLLRRLSFFQSFD